MSTALCLAAALMLALMLAFKAGKVNDRGEVARKGIARSTELAESHAEQSGAKNLKLIKLRRRK